MSKAYNKIVTCKASGISYRFFSLLQNEELNGKIVRKDFIVESEEYGLP